MGKRENAHVFYCLFFRVVNPLPNNKILHLSKLKAFADDKISVSKFEIYFWKNKKQCGKRRKCWLPAFSPFPTILSKSFFFQGHQKSG